MYFKPLNFRRGKWKIEHHMLLDSISPVVQAVSGSKFPRQWHFPLFVHIWRKKICFKHIYRSNRCYIFHINHWKYRWTFCFTVNISYLTQGSLVEFGHYWNLKLLQFCESIQPFVRDNLSYCPWTIDIGIISRYTRNDFQSIRLSSMD